MKISCRYDCNTHIMMFCILINSIVLHTMLWELIPITTQWDNHGPSIPLVFAGSVLWTEKIHRTELNQTMVWSIFRLWLPKFGVILVAGCLISKIIQNCSKTGWNQLQLVKRSRALHSLVTTFITFNLIFGSSKTVKNWERYNEIHFGINTFFVQPVPEWL